MTRPEEGSARHRGAGAEPFLPVHDQVARQSPEQLALRTREGSLSYGELNARANQFARRLASLGLAGGALVGVCLDRSPDAVVALLGVLRSGHPFLPLDPRQPRSHLAGLLQVAGAAALVTHSRLWSPEPALALPVFAIDRERPRLEAESAAPPGLPTEPGDLAYCLFTSGTSGRPKCVEITHASLSVYPGAFNSKLDLGHAGRYLHCASFAFSASMRQLFVPFSVGACVVLAGAEQVRDPLGLLRLIQQEEVTVLDWVPSYLRSVCAELERCTPAQRRRLLDNQAGTLVSSGEPLSWSLAQQWRRSSGFAGRIASCYGQTETTGLIAWYELPPEPPPQAPTWVPLGTALPQAELFALDADLRPAAEGKEGDLWAAGPCVARGYRGGAPPKSGPAAPGLHPTGDRVRVEAGGGFLFVGRNDDQVKVNGVRVDLAEAEEALRSHPGVQDAAVIAAEDGEGTLRLHAFLEPRPGSIADGAAVRRHLREHYPDPLQPHQITWRDPLPRTLSGKADRPALRASLDPAATVAAASSAQADVEVVVQAAWSAALGGEAGEGDFFELGGDSLQAIAMLGRIATALQLNTPLIAAFFGEPSRSGLLRVLQSGQAAPPAPPLTGLPRVPWQRESGPA